jgi:hypothetical protein
MVTGAAYQIQTIRYLQTTMTMVLLMLVALMLVALVLVLLMLPPMLLLMVTGAVYQIQTIHCLLTMMVMVLALVLLMLPPILPPMLLLVVIGKVCQIQTIRCLLTTTMMVLEETAGMPQLHMLYRTATTRSSEWHSVDWGVLNNRVLAYGSVCIGSTDVRSASRHTHHRAGCVFCCNGKGEGKGGSGSVAMQPAHLASLS